MELFDNTREIIELGVHADALLQHESFKPITDAIEAEYVELILRSSIGNVELREQAYATILGLRLFKASLTTYSMKKANAIEMQENALHEDEQ